MLVVTNQNLELEIQELNYFVHIKQAGSEEYYGEHYREAGPAEFLCNLGGVGKEPAPQQREEKDRSVCLVIAEERNDLREYGSGLVSVQPGEVEHVLDNEPSLRKRIGNEESSRHRYKAERKEHAYNHGDLDALSVHPGSQTNEGAVDDSPNNKVPTRTVPEAGYEEGDHCCHIVITILNALAEHAAEDVIAEESRKRHVPTLPVILEIACLKGRVEVLGDLDVEHPAHTDRHVGVTGKVEVVCNRVLKRVIPRRHEWHVVADIIKVKLSVGTHRVGKEHLLGRTDREKEETERDILGLKTEIVLVLKLADHLGMVNDGTYDQLREERDEQQVVEDVVILGELLVRIDNVGNKLECEERDTDRQDNVFEREIGAEDRVSVFNKEVSVLVVSEQSHVAEDAERAQDLALNLVRRIHPAERDTDHIVGKNASHEEREEVGCALRVEEERSDDQPELRKGEPFEVIEHVVNYNYCRKEQKYKFIGCENHDKPFLISGAWSNPAPSFRKTLCTGS